MYLFKKLFGGTSSKKGTSQKEPSEEAPYGRKSMKNPTYSVSRIERSKLPSVEDLKAYYEEHGIGDNTKSNNIKADEISEVEEHSIFRERTDESKQTKQKQVAVVCPMYQNLSAISRQTSNQKTNEESLAHDQSPEPQYANAQELVAKGNVNVKDTSDYQNLHVNRQTSDTTKSADYANIYQNIPNVSPAFSPSETSMQEEDSDYEVAVSLPRSQESPKKAKPQRPPLPSAAALRNTEYFKINGNFRQNERKTCPSILEKPHRVHSISPSSGKAIPVQSESLVTGRKLQGRLNSETTSTKQSSPLTLRKVSSMNDLTEDAEDYLEMKDKHNRKLFTPGETDNPKCQMSQNLTTDDTEDYLDMSENNPDITAENDDDNKDDYLDMSENNQDISVKNYDDNEDDKDNYIPMILDDNDT